jgi:transposase
MGQVTTIGLDIAKSVFQVHGIDATGEIILRRRLTRARLVPFFAKLAPCLVGIEACASAHYWARELRKLGHDARLMPPSYVKPYVKRQKNDMADAEAICEAVTRPTMRFVEVKTPEQQSVMVLHRTRLMLMRQRTQLSNAIRGHIAEFGLVAPIGRMGLQTLINILFDEKDDRVPTEARHCLQMLADQLRFHEPQARSALTLSGPGRCLERSGAWLAPRRPLVALRWEVRAEDEFTIETARLDTTVCFGNLIE